MRDHLLFYDGHCGLCDRIVNFVLEVDDKQLFVFAPLQGETAKKLAPSVTGDTLILIENYQTQGRRVYLYGKGAFRVFWLLGGLYRLIGWPFFLPAFLYDWGYRLVARYRHRFFDQESCQVYLANNKDRFLS